MIKKGWPVKRKDCHESIQDCWTFRDELAYRDELVYRAPNFPIFRNSDFLIIILVILVNRKDPV